MRPTGINPVARGGLPLLAISSQHGSVGKAKKTPKMPVNRTFSNIAAVNEQPIVNGR
jgi:hypothetical protein